MARLLLFAAVREAAGCREVELAVASVGEALAEATDRFGPEFGRLLPSCAVLVDETALPQARAWDTPVGTATEIALLPPVSGGAGGHAEHPAPVARVAVLTVSDRCASGERADGAGPAVERVVEAWGHQVVGRAVVADEREQIEAVLRAWSEPGGAEVVVTTGGTGLGPRDVTPEATLAVVDRQVPGIAEAMRAAGLRVTAYAALSRQVAGQRNGTLIVNLPGSPKGATESLEAVIATLAHASELIRDGQPP